MSQEWTWTSNGYRDKAGIDMHGLVSFLFSLQNNWFYDGSTPVQCRGCPARLFSAKSLRESGHAGSQELCHKLEYESLIGPASEYGFLLPLAPGPGVTMRAISENQCQYRTFL
jgi:hypothetical protein